MPLMQGKSPSAFQQNLKTEIHAGKPMKQSLAIAYAVKRRQNKAKGGLIQDLEKHADYEEPSMADLMDESNLGSDRHPEPMQVEDDSMEDEVPSEFDLKANHYALGGIAQKKPGFHDPKAVAAAIGRKKFGPQKMGMVPSAKGYSSGGWIDDETGDEFEGAPWLREDHMPLDPYRSVDGEAEFSPQIKGDEMKEEDRLKRKRGMLHAIMSGLQSKHMG